MAERKDGKPKKKTGFHLFPLVFEPKKPKNEVEEYEKEKIRDMKAYKDRQTLRRL